MQQVEDQVKLKVEERESIVLTNEGQKIFGILHLPVTQSPCPAILICHGLAGQKTGKCRLYVSLAKRLAQEGIATLRIDFRGAGDSEGDFADTTLDGVISDALLGLKFLSDHDKIDASRIGIFGRSFGGAVAILASEKFGLVKSIVLWAPLFAGEQWIAQWNKLQSSQLNQVQKEDLMRINGQLGSERFFEQFFKMRIDKSLPVLESVPFLVIHGEKDSVVNVGHTDLYAKHRATAKEQTKCMKLPNGDHEFSAPQDQTLAIETTVQWLKETLRSPGV